MRKAAARPPCPRASGTIQPARKIKGDTLSKVIATLCRARPCLCGCLRRGQCDTPPIPTYLVATTTRWTRETGPTGCFFLGRLARPLLLFAPPLFCTGGLSRPALPPPPLPIFGEGGTALMRKETITRHQTPLILTALRHSPVTNETLRATMVGRCCVDTRVPVLCRVWWSVGRVRLW